MKDSSKMANLMDKVQIFSKYLGKYTWLNGIFYHGEWINGFKNGKGVL